MAQPTVPAFAGANQAKSVLADWFAPRAPFRDDFLGKNGLSDAVLTSMREDMGARRYFRLTRQDGTTAVLMESVPDGHEYATPGQRLDDYVMIAGVLRRAGLSAPQIYASDFETGYLLIEDFGDTSFRSALLSGQVSREDIYSSAMDAIARFPACRWPEGLQRSTYYDSVMYHGLRRMADWYIPVKRGRANEPELLNDFLARWRQVEDEATLRVGPVPQGFVHNDFHLENLQWRAGATGLDRCGILDFQDARQGPVVYDLANLLNDARMSLDPAYKQALLNQFLEGRSAAERENFIAWFWIYSGQFLHRVAGQFVKHAIIGNTRYMQFMPFIQANLKDIMRQPHLAPLADFMDVLSVDLEPFAANADYASWAKLIAPDAF